MFSPKLSPILWSSDLLLYLAQVWMAEQKAEAYKKRQEELRQQYEKEQDLHDNKAMLSKESKDKLAVSFMYEPPPGELIFLWLETPLQFVKN